MYHCITEHGMWSDPLNRKILTDLISGSIEEISALSLLNKLRHFCEVQYRLAWLIIRKKEYLFFFWLRQEPKVSQCLSAHPSVYLCGTKCSYSLFKSSIKALHLESYSRSLKYFVSLSNVRVCGSCALPGYYAVMSLSSEFDNIPEHASLFI